MTTIPRSRPVLHGVVRQEERDINLILLQEESFGGGSLTVMTTSWSKCEPPAAQ